MLPGWIVWPCAVLAAALTWRRGVAAAIPPPRPRCSGRARSLSGLARRRDLLCVAGHGGHAARQCGGPSRRRPARRPRAFSSIGHLLALGWQWPTIRLLAGNVVVFVPFGLLAPAAFAGLATWRRMLLAALALSVSIELGQLAVSLLVGYSYRVTEIDDVILNVFGVMLGYVLWSSLAGGAAGGWIAGANGDGDAIDA